MKSVLVVDDEEALRGLIGDVIRSMGLTVYTADNGETALELLDEKVVDLVVTDYQMPKMNGLDLVVRIKADPSHTCPVIVVTGNAGLKETSPFDELGVHSVVGKPFDPDELMAIVDSALGKTAA